MHMHIWYSCMFVYIYIYIYTHINILYRGGHAKPVRPVRDHEDAAALPVGGAVTVGDLISTSRMQKTYD